MKKDAQKCQVGQVKQNNGCLSFGFLSKRRRKVLTTFACFWLVDPILNVLCIFFKYLLHVHVLTSFFFKLLNDTCINKVFYSILFYSITLHSIPLHFTPPHCTALHCTALHSTPLHSTPPIE